MHESSSGTPIRTTTQSLKIRVHGGIRIHGGSRSEFFVPAQLASDDIIFNKRIAKSLAALAASTAQQAKARISKPTRRLRFNYDGAVSDDNDFADALSLQQRTDKEGYALEVLSLIYSPAGGAAQAWHQDVYTTEPTGALKVQVPLVDVPAELGPTELEPARTGRARCLSVLATTRKGSAILYYPTVKHRGSENTHAWRNRTVLDYSYMTPLLVERNDYSSRYSELARSTMQAHRERFAVLCDSAGVACAAPATVARIRTSSIEGTQRSR
jgi:ectoine hydroxylase-related dioxygenase (phytanoyl-CoA dioxygenase family)